MTKKEQRRGEKGEGRREKGEGRRKKGEERGEEKREEKGLSIMFFLYVTFCARGMCVIA